jgi:lipoprotein Spr
MKKRLYLFTIVCVLTVAVSSCQSSHKAVAQQSNKQPQFLDNVYIAGHNKTNATADAVAVIKKPATKKKAETHKPTPKPQPQVDAKEVAYAGKDPMAYAPHHRADRRAEKASEEQEDNARELRKKYAAILGVKPKELQNVALFAFIDRWYGTNYKLGGSDISGIDCSGFVQRLYSEVYGVDLVRTAVDQSGNCKRIKHYKDAEEGDLVFFKTHGKRITHVGVYLANDYFVHASSSQGVVISNLNEEYWQRYFVGAGRMPHGEQLLELEGRKDDKQPEQLQPEH